MLSPETDADYHILIDEIYFLSLKVEAERFPEFKYLKDYNWS